LLDYFTKNRVDLSVVTAMLNLEKKVKDVSEIDEELLKDLPNEVSEK